MLFVHYKMCLIKLSSLSFSKSASFELLGFTKVLMFTQVLRCVGRYNGWNVVFSGVLVLY